MYMKILLHHDLKNQNLIDGKSKKHKTLKVKLCCFKRQKKQKCGKLITRRRIHSRLESILSLNADTAVGPVSLFLLQDIGVPSHRIVTQAGLWSVDVVMGIHPGLTITRLFVIIGNGLAGECLLVTLEVTPVPVLRTEPLELTRARPNVVLVIAVMHEAAEHKQEESVSHVSFLGSCPTLALLNLGSCPVLNLVTGFVKSNWWFVILRLRFLYLYIAIVILCGVELRL